MRTKFLSMLLVVTLLATLAACSDPTTPNTPAEESPGKNSSSDNSNSGDQLTQADETLGLFNVDATLEETVMVDEGGVKITATGLTYTDYSVDLDLTIENNSGKTLSFVSGSLGYSCNSINGYMVNDGYLNCDVSDGKKANDSISFNYDTLMLYGIDEIADMEIGFSMTDDEYNTIYSGPRQLKTSAYDTHDYSTDHYQETITSRAAMSTYGYEMACFSNDALYDENGVKLLSSGIIKNGDGETALLLELENTTDSMVGYKNDRYLYFCRAAARLDDVANYLPARGAALLLVAAAALTGQSAAGAFRIWRRDRRCHASPNSAQTEAAMAGALRVQLAGPAYYFGKLYEKPTIGDDSRPIGPADIARAGRMLYAAGFLAVALGAAVRFVIVWIL